MSEKLKDFDLYSFPEGHTGKRTYVSVRGHAKSVPYLYTYKGTDGYNYIRPEYGGNLDGIKDLSTYAAPMIMRDMSAYKSPLDGSMITSRSQHRAHMAQHDVIEIGNERPPTPRPQVDLPSAGKDIKRAIEQVKARAVA